MLPSQLSGGMGARMATLTGSFTNLNSVYGKLFCVHYWAHVYTYYVHSSIRIE